MTPRDKRNDPAMKLCSKCGIDRPRSEFYRRASSHDGLRSECRPCGQATARLWHRMNPERSRAASADYRLRKPDEIAEHDRARSKAAYDAKWGPLRKALRAAAAAARPPRERKPVDLAKIREKSRKWNRENQERARTNRQVWAAANRDRVRVKGAVYRGRKRASGGTFSVEQWDALKVAFGNRCAYCLKQLPLEIEHMMPVSRGGATEEANIVPACRSCNARKYNSTPLEWLARGG